MHAEIDCLVRNLRVAMTVLRHQHHIPVERHVETIVTIGLCRIQVAETVARSLQDHPLLVHEAVERHQHLHRPRVTCSNLHEVDHHAAIRLRIRTMADSISLRPSRFPQVPEVSSKSQYKHFWKLIIFQIQHQTDATPMSVNLQLANQCQHQLQLQLHQQRPLRLKVQVYTQADLTISPVDHQDH
jgi:hypothetical protein